MNSNTNHHSKKPYIIAIGASAGGMEAIHLLFDHTPEDDVAYVIIQHLSPDHKSFMAELLEKHSKLQICVAENGMSVEPNQVYLMPQGKNMTIDDRILILNDIDTHQRNTTIDIFFDSLAVDQKEKSIAIILSGTGSDGTKGIAAIKQNGGFVIVQDPQSAKFDGMPKSAIESGNVDAILSPELIPREIIAHIGRDILEQALNDQDTEIDESALHKILELIQIHTPLDFSNYKRPTIIRRLVNRMTKNKISSMQEYVEYLEKNPQEINILTKEFLISVTKFFRDKEAFDTIREKILPDIIKNKLQVDTLKVWVVGCATGEEAYSIAILIMEYLTEIQKNLEVKIFASDIDKAAILFASRGVYPENISKDVSEKRLHKYFTRQNDKYKVRESIRKMIIFADHDIVKQPPYGKIDLISCRNLLIYINPFLQRKILSSLHFCLNRGGYLFLGPSEGLGELKNSFSEVDKKWKIFRSTKESRNLRDNTYTTPDIATRMVTLDSGTLGQKNLIKNNLTKLIYQTLLEESGYEAGIWVNREFEIIQTCGNYEKYLLPKIFNFNLLEMLPEELSIATSISLLKGMKQNKMISIKQIEFEKEGIKHSVNITIKPYLNEISEVQEVILVLFNDEENQITAQKDVEIFKIETHISQHLEDMKSELNQTKQKLREAYEALDISNDNISSYNEELISSNEEMQSTNEELQSVNEELQTVNNEYQLKIKELAELNDDLNNYFRSTVNAQLYVDKNFILRKYTPSAILQVNLKESDIGRPLTDLSTNIRFSTMMDDIRQVISLSTPIEKEVQTIDGRWYQMMVIPYVKQISHENNGVIITFNDITELKKIQNKLSRINADHDTFIYAASHDLKAPLNNLKALIDMLKDSVDLNTDHEIELFQMIQLSIANLSLVIHELSDITKIQSDADVQESTNLILILKELKLSMKEELLKSNATIQTDLKVLDIPFSRKNLRCIVSNILNNAIKYRSPDRTPIITIKTELVDQYILLSIEDNGLGINEANIKKIFGKFHRAHTHVEGSGVGLYLVKKTITIAGGDIEVESEVGKGSIFKVYFNNSVLPHVDAFKG